MHTDVHIRSTSDGDRAAILDTVHEAFSANTGEGREEVEIVESVWSLEPSIVACELVAVAGKQIVGHVLASLGRLDGVALPGIAPLAVAPERQGQGIGAALMTELIERLEQLGFPLIVVLGDPKYYGRFGFRPSGLMDVIYPPAGAGNPHFQLLRLGDDREPHPRGTFVYSWESAIG
jgi:putative acetyltransferase